MKKIKKLLSSIIMLSLITSLTTPLIAYAEDGGLIELWETFPDKSKNGSGSHGDDDDRWRCSWHRVISDASYNLNVRNAFDYSTTNFIGSAGIFAGIEGGKVNTSNSEKSASLSGFDTQHLVPNWKFSLYRDKVKDKITLYPNKNSSQITNDMSLIGVDSTSYIPSNRVAKEGSGNFKDKFSINYVYENLDRTLSWRSAGCGSHGDNGTYNGTPNMGLDAFNNSYSVANNVITKYYLGKENKGTVQPDSTNSAFSIGNKVFKASMSTKLQSNHNIKFYPMIKMTYQTQNTGKQDVFVTSVNESTVLAPVRVEVGVYKDSSKPGLALDSTQWSTHAKTQEYLTRAGISDKNSVLPGGAIYDLKASKVASDKTSDNWVGVHTYQVCVPDANMERLSSKDGVISESQANQQLNDFLTQVQNNLEHFQIVQWVAEGMLKNEAEFKSQEQVLVCGPGQKSSFGGNTLDRSGKYYLKVDGSGADRSDLDIVGKVEEKIVWTLSSDADGNVTVKNDKGVNVVVDKTHGISDLLSNSNIKTLNDRTMLVTNFISALDRNQGNNRNGDAWYNEGFEEIKVIENYVGYQIGLGNGQEARSSALDTKLTGKLGDRRDLYNFDESTLKEKTRTSQFRTSARSTDPSANGKAPGYIGSIDGLDIVIPNIENLMTSKIFYIPNASVTDLN